MKMRDSLGLGTQNLTPLKLQCVCMPCPVHDSFPEQAFRDANAKQASHERYQQHSLAHQIVLGDIAGIGTHKESVGLNEEVGNTLEYCTGRCSEHAPLGEK